MDTLAELIVFSLVSGRTDDDVVQDLEDVLEDLVGDHWRFVAWRRTEMTRFIVQAPVGARSAVLNRDLDARIRSLAQVLDDMGNQNNEWLVPYRSAGPRLDLAMSMVETWLNDQWPERSEDTPPRQPPPPVHVVDPPPVASRLRRPHRPSTQEQAGTSDDPETSEGEPVQPPSEGGTISVRAADAVLAAFNIQPGQRGDLSGSALPLTTFRRIQKD